MKHLTFADKSLFIDDESAAALLEYARLVSSAGASETVTLRAVGMDGNAAEVTLLLTPAVELVIESTDSPVELPVDQTAVAHMRDRIDRLSGSDAKAGAADWAPINMNDDI